MLVFFQAAHSSTASLAECTQGERGLEIQGVCTMVEASSPSEQFLLWSKRIQIWRIEYLSERGLGHDKSPGDVTYPGQIAPTCKKVALALPLPAWQWRSCKHPLRDCLSALERNFLRSQGLSIAALCSVQISAHTKRKYVSRVVFRKAWTNPGK